MADFSALKTSIQNYIKQNGNEEITGNLLQQILLSMVTTLGDSAINDLVTALNAEIANRGNADTTLQGNIDNEATARGNADTELGGRITTLQGVVNGIVANVENGYVYAGIATPSATPVSGKVFYLALTAGTYTNFGATVVPQGINILKYNGSAWSLDSFLGLDDAPTQGSGHLVKSGGVLDSIIKDGSAFDLSAYNNGTTYADLSAALTALNALPAVYKKGGMSVKYVQTYDNKYVQYRLMSNSFSTTVSDWQGVDDVPTAGSDNLVKSGGVKTALNNNLTYIRKNIYIADAWIDGNGAYNTTDYSGAKVLVVIVKQGDKLKIKANNQQNTYYAIFQDLSVASTRYSIVKGESSSIVDISSDGYLVFNHSYNGNDYTPTIIEINGIDILEDYSQVLYDYISSKTHNIVGVGASYEDITSTASAKWLFQEPLSCIKEKAYIKSDGSVAMLLYNGSTNIGYLTTEWKEFDFSNIAKPQIFVAQQQQASSVKIYVLTESFLKEMLEDEIDQKVENIKGLSSWEEYRDKPMISFEHEVGWYYDENGNKYSNDSFAIVYLPLSKNKTIVFNGDMGVLSLWFMNADKQLISLCESIGARFQSVSGLYSPDNTAYLAVSCGTGALEIRFATCYLSGVNPDGKKWIRLGDSITYGTLGDVGGSTTSQDFADRSYQDMANMLYFHREMVNLGVGGMGFVREQNSKCACDVADDLSNTYNGEIISVAYGINDWIFNSPLGTESSTENDGTIYGNVKYTLKTIVTNNPNSLVFVISPFNVSCAYAESHPETNYAIGTANGIGVTLAQIFNAIKYCCDLYGIQFVDMTYNNSAINYININNVLADKTHPNISTSIMLANMAKVFPL